MTDLIERLQEAAITAIANERPSLAHGPARLRAIVLGLQIANGGDVADGTCYVERKVQRWRR